MNREYFGGKKGRVILVNPGIHLFPPFKDRGMYPNNAIQILGTILHQNGFDVRIVDKVHDPIKLYLQNI